MVCVAPLYRPRDAEHTVLHQVIAEHLEAFVSAAAEAGGGVGLPQFVEQEFRAFLACGVFEAGVARGFGARAAGASTWCRSRVRAADSVRVVVGGG